MSPPLNHCEHAWRIESIAKSSKLHIRTPHMLRICYAYATHMLRICIKEFSVLLLLRNLSPILQDDVAYSTLQYILKKYFDPARQLLVTVREEILYNNDYLQNSLNALWRDLKQFKQALRTDEAFQKWVLESDIFKSVCPSKWQMLNSHACTQ